MRERLRKVSLILLCGIMLLTGCSKSGGKSPSEISVSSGDLDNDAFPALACGVKLEKAPERIVSLSPATTEIICELGFVEKLVGISDYCDYPEGLSAERVGSTENPDIDVILELKPDAVFTLSALSERENRALNQANIAVLTANPPKNTEDFSAMYSEIAAAFYGTKRSDAHDDLTRSEQIGKNALSSLENAAKSVRLGSFIYVTGKLTAAGAGTFEGAVLELSGENVCKIGGYVPLDMIENTPDYIIVDSSLTEYELTANAVLNGYINGGAKVRFVDAALFERPSSRTATVFEQIKDNI